jgi:DNA-directed RNA polymerase specialized sigma subunit
MKELLLIAKLKNNRLMKCRHELNLSQTQVGKLIYISGTIISNYENLRIFPLKLSFQRPQPILNALSEDKKRWKDSAKAIAKFYKKPIDYLWPDSMLSIYLHMETPQYEKEIDAAKYLEAQPEQLSIQERIDSNDLAERLNLEVYNLKPVSAKIIMRRFGLDGYKPQTLEEVGETFNISRERTRQWETSGLRRLRGILKEQNK